MSTSASQKEILAQFTLSVPEAENGCRLDRFITGFLKELVENESVVGEAHDAPKSRAQVSRWIAAELVQIDGKLVTKAGTRLKPGASVELKVPAPTPTTVLPDPSVSFKIVYEDDSLLVIDKPPGLVVHPGAGNKSSTLVHGLVAHLGDALVDVGGLGRPGLVHRLDKDTSGLLVVAKTRVAYGALVSQLQQRDMTRKYLAVARSMPSLSTPISLPIGRHPTKRIKMAVNHQTGRAAVTHWKALEEFSWGALLELRLETGRTHQIRVHLEAAGAAIVGDSTYGPSLSSYPPELRSAVKALGRQALHAYRLSFEHPLSRELVNFQSELPGDIEELIGKLRHGV